MSFFDKLKQLKNLELTIQANQQEIEALNKQITTLDKQTKEQHSVIEKLNKDIAKSEQASKLAVDNRDRELEITHKRQQGIIESYKERLESAKSPYDAFMEEFNQLKADSQKAERNIVACESSLKVYRKLIKKIHEDLTTSRVINPSTDCELTRAVPEIELHLHSHDIKQLKSDLAENNKAINKTLERYEKRYTTKTNRALYQLMVIALQAEMQNILIYLKFNTLQNCKNKLNSMIDKYTAIVTEGNQSIAPTIRTFVLEMSVLFEAKIDIEYEYYTKKEQERQEQLALKEQMRQEEEERKALEAEKKKVEKEEEKYKSEISNIEKQLAECTDSDKITKLEEKIKELMEQLSQLETKKEEILKRQNGKAGYVYVISNLGSFGECTFKVGMTRRLDPMDRIKELGDASVPFSFDVHSFIFSDDAVGLEAELHKRLHSKRKNKVNNRKEFFDISIDELETLVQEINPAAEFNRTMVAMEYRQSLEQ